MLIPTSVVERIKTPIPESASVRLSRVLRSYGLNSLESIADLSAWEFLRLKDCGRTSLKEMEFILNSNGLTFSAQGCGKILEFSWLPAITYREKSRMKCVYFIANKSMTAVKIGYTKSSLIYRMEGLQIGNHEELILLGVIPEEGRRKEGELHKTFHAFWIRGEWFRLEGSLKSFIEESAVQI